MFHEGILKETECVVNQFSKSLFSCDGRKNTVGVEENVGLSKFKGFMFFSGAELHLSWGSCRPRPGSFCEEVSEGTKRSQLNQAGAQLNWTWWCFLSLQ